MPSWTRSAAEETLRPGPSPAPPPKTAEHPRARRPQRHDLQPLLSHSQPTRETAPLTDMPLTRENARHAARAARTSHITQNGPPRQTRSGPDLGFYMGGRCWVRTNVG
jgi:hypothetical protein